MTGNKTLARLAAALLATALLAGCGNGGELPVNNPEKSNPVPSATPAAEPLPTAESPAPAGSEAPLIAEQPVWKFPLAVDGLFGGQAVPEGFAFPIHLWEDGSKFLFAARDGSVLRARWSGSAYTMEPVAEMLDIGDGICAIVDRDHQRLYAHGSKYLPGGGAEPAIVMVDLATTERCNLCDLVGWKEEGLVLSGDCQVAGGTVLVRLQEDLNGKHVVRNKWAAIDVADKAYWTVDLDAFAAAHLAQWGNVDSVRLVIPGAGRMVAFFSVSGAAPAAITVPNGLQEACLAFLLDEKGTLVRDLGQVAAADSLKPAIVRGRGYVPSPDGRWVLFGREEGGVALYQVETNRETVLAGGAAKLSFAQWVADGTVIYGVGTGRAIRLERVDVSAGMASPSPEASPAQ